MGKICCFAGHSRLARVHDLPKRIITVLEALITEEQVTEFWVGNYGDFDRMAAATVRALKTTYPYIRLHLVIPYLTANINRHKEHYYEQYDHILLAEIPENTPKPLWILKCNQYMIQQSQFLVCYVEFNWGGAAKTLAYAQKQKHIQIYNLV